MLDGTPVQMAWWEEAGDPGGNPHGHRENRRNSTATVTPSQDRNGSSGSVIRKPSDPIIVAEVKSLLRRDIWRTTSYTCFLTTVSRFCVLIKRLLGYENCLYRTWLPLRNGQRRDGVWSKRETYQCKRQQTLTGRLIPNIFFTVRSCACL